MKKVVRAAAGFSSESKANKVLHDLRQLRDSLEDLYNTDEELFDKLDLASLDDEVLAATMFVAHELGK